ncbi:MAG TPA: hypothetical protein VGU44_02150 [Gammaproteobacteria bacterium]|nr:hypothetical protein [Gammaproteobacteria bacterium]
MLTSFRNVKNVEKVKEQKKEQEQLHDERLKLLFEAIDQIEGNENRVYIEERPYRAELKLPAGLELKTLKSQKIQTSESKNVGDGILVHTFFVMSEQHPSFEVSYKPIATPRL